MKNFSNYTDYDKKDNLHFESKAVHGALGTEPLTGAVSMPIFQAVTYRHPALGEFTAEHSVLSVMCSENTALSTLTWRWMILTQ